MNRPARIALVSGGSIVLLILVLLAAGTYLAQSAWLREQVRRRIVAEVEKATGGRVESGAFRFDWRTLTAQLDSFVIHGKEPPGQAPLLTIERLTVGLKIVSLIGRDIDLARIEVARPQAHLIVLPDGSTNLPEPKIASKSPETIPELVLDLRIKRFDLLNGAILAESPGRVQRVAPWNARGDNLTARFTYDPAKPAYAGDLSISPLRLEQSGFEPVGIEVHARVAIGRNRIAISNATAKTAQSQFELSNIAIQDFVNPVITAQYDARVSLAEAGRLLRFRSIRTGTLQLAGNARYRSSSDYEVAGPLRSFGIEYRDRGVLLRIARIEGYVKAEPNEIKLDELRAAVLGGAIRANARIRRMDAFAISGSLEHFNVHQIGPFVSPQPVSPQLASSQIASPQVPYDGWISGPFEAEGRLSELKKREFTAKGTLTISPGEGQPVHGLIAGRYNGRANKLQLENSFIELPNTRLEVAGTLGDRLAVKFTSRDLKDLSPVIDLKTLPVSLQNGSVKFNGAIEGPLTNPRLAGHTDVQKIVYQGQPIDSASADLIADRANITVSNGVLAYDRLQGTINGSVGLRDWRVAGDSPVKADLHVSNADLARLLAIAGRKDIPLTGTVTANGQILGTVANPRAAADIRLSKGEAYGESYDAVSAHARYDDKKGQTITAQVDSGVTRVNMRAQLDRTSSSFLDGKLRFEIASNRMELNQFATIRKLQPGITGTATVKADGIVEITAHEKNPPSYQIVSLNADASANGLQLDGRQIGDVHLIAETQKDILTARIDSNIAQSAIHGDATIQLAGDYAMKTRLTFSKTSLNAIARVVAMPVETTTLHFDGALTGQLTASGPASKPELIRAELDIPQFEIHPLSNSALASNLPNASLKNSGPLRITMADSTVRFQSMRLQGPSTDLSVTGVVAMKQKAPVDVRVAGDLNLAILQSFNQDLSSAGVITLNAAVHGTLRDPDLSGQAQLRNGDFHFADLSNGLTNVSGTILFSGARATIQTLTAESGGGKVSATGFAAYTGGTLAFRLETIANQVRVRYPEGVSTIADAKITFAGTSQRSQASGTVTIQRLAINPRSDAARILVQTAEPVRTASVESGLLSTVNLDIQIETSPDIALQSSLAQGLAAEASLRLRGTAATPALLGRINVTEGDLVFFGTKYTITQGTISFFNPVKIDPILGVDLETKVRGVNVVITVSGSLTKLNVSYRSDPPLQFSDIVALLATGRAPTDPSVAVRDTAQSQTLQQMGASALLGQAIASPVSGRLQRFFGVSRLKVDPMFQGVTGSPQARVTIEQQITPELLFTYITDVSNTSAQLIRIEWAFNKSWSAIFVREESGYVGLDFAYKTRFK